MKHQVAFLLGITTVTALLLSGCCAPFAMPVFQPNAHYQCGAPSQAHADAQVRSNLAKQSMGAVICIGVLCRNVWQNFATKPLVGIEL